MGFVLLDLSANSGKPADGTANVLALKMSVATACAIGILCCSLRDSELSKRCMFNPITTTSVPTRSSAAELHKVAGRAQSQSRMQFSLLTIPPDAFPPDTFQQRRKSKPPERVPRTFKTKSHLPASLPIQDFLIHLERNGNKKCSKMLQQNSWSASSTRPTKQSSFLVDVYTDS